MASMALEDFDRELHEQLNFIVPRIEGLHDFDRLNLAPDTHTKVREMIAVYERRQSLIEATRANLTNLRTDQYPINPTETLIAQLFNDLQGNVNTILAAFDRFVKEEEASSAIIIAAEPEHK